MVLAHKAATYEDLRKLPESVRAEVIHGEVVVAPPPLMRHGLAQADVAAQLRPARLGSGGGDLGWWIATEVDIQMAAHEIYRPDVAGWRRSRVPVLPDSWPVDLLPDWVCEVLSPSNQRDDRMKKMAVYRDCGVAHAWLVDPAIRTLEAYQNDGKHWILLGTWSDGDVLGIAPFETFDMDVGALFEPLPAEK
jgi:Uma2 family endonuclease